MRSDSVAFGVFASRSSALAAVFSCPSSPRTTAPAVRIRASSFTEAAFV